MFSVLQPTRTTQNLIAPPRRFPPSTKKLKELENSQPRAKQLFDALLVLDVEATCISGSGFDWPNEIIEWPVCLMRWKDRSSDGKASRLEVVDEFHSFVKPTWRPQLSRFCTELTGITQAQIDQAPSFPQAIRSFSNFLAKNGLIHPRTGERLAYFCWCSDTPCDIRDFVVKQCFISKIPIPDWLRGDILDIRMAVGLATVPHPSVRKGKGKPTVMVPVSRYRSLNIPMQLVTLGLPPFEGRLHSGVDDARNLAKILAELARRGIGLHANTVIHPGKRWFWMGKSGEVLEEYIH